jgi:hypothetical protein
MGVHDREQSMKLMEVDIVDPVDEFDRSARSEEPSRRLSASAFES